MFSLVRYIVCALILACFARTCLAGDRPYFITYDHTMEEPGSLEIEASGRTGQPKERHVHLRPDGV